MLKLMKRCSCSLLMLAIAALPAVAGNDAKPATENAATPAAASTTLAPTAGDANITALIGALVTKGVLAPSEANAIRNAAPENKFQLLVEALKSKGVLTAADLSAASNAPAQPSPSPTPAAAPAPAPAPMPAPEPLPQAKAEGPAVVPAIAPLRVLPVDPPKHDGLNAAFKMGAVKMTPYGFIKSTAAKDTSAPNGDDFPFVGLFLTTPGATTLSTGPTQDPEFHLKARSTRIGANFEWPDISPKITLTGRVEGDYEGNFSEVDNRDVSSIRSNAFQLRLAWARLDYAASENTDFYFEGGQDWTLFGSSVLPSILETTFLGAFYGDVYERSPQFQFGFVQKVGGGVKINPTFAIMMPSTGQILKLGSLGLAAQIGEAERAGADSGRPEVEGRLAIQFPLDKAPGVAPAQIIWSGFEARRTAIAAKELYPACGENTVLCSYEQAFPNGFTASSTLYGNQIAVQLPTRWFTLIASGYRGGDMRFFFGGQVNTYYTDISGLSSPIQFNTTDGTLAAAGPTMLACNVSTASGTCPAGNVVVAPEKPIQSFGGFVNLGLPLSRWFNANPKGHNAGWTLYFHAGKDQVVKRFLTMPDTQTAGGALPLLMGKVFAATLYYKLNPWVTFGFEQSVYGTRLALGAGTNCVTGPGLCYDIAGSSDNLWQDHRTEFGPIFSF